MTTTNTKIEIAGHVFSSPEELEKYVNEQKDLVKLGRQLLKAHKPTMTKARSVKSLVTEEVASLCNSDSQVMSMLEGVTQSFQMRLRYDVETKSMSAVAVHRVSGTGNNSFHGSRALIVDGVEYKSARAAMVTLCPETKDMAPKNRKQIIAYLTHQDHGKHTVNTQEG